MYIQPQVQVFQEFRQLPTEVVKNLNAFVFGPNYELMRYGQPSEKLLIGLGAYNANSDMPYSYPNQPAGTTIDLNYVKLYMDDVWAQYAAIAASVVDPLVVQSSNARNKFRAMPRIDTATAPATSNGVTMSVGGCYHDGPELPETVYFWPTGGAVDGYLSRLLARTSLWDIEDSTLAHRALTSGANGTTALLASENPLGSGVKMQGPYGIVFDLDTGARQASVLTYTGQPTDDTDVIVLGSTFTFKASGAVAPEVNKGDTARATYDNLRMQMEATLAGNPAFAEVIHVHGATTATGTIIVVGTGVLTITGDADNRTIYATDDFASVRQPVVLTVKNTTGTAQFTLTVADEAIAARADRAIDDGVPTTVELLDGNEGIGSLPAVGATWETGVEDKLTLIYSPGVTTLGELYNAIVSDSDITAIFDVSAIDGSVDATVDLVVDESSAPEAFGIDIKMIPDVYRVRVLANEITWKTGNGYTHSNLFKGRGVVLNDTIRYSVLAPDALTYTGTSKVAGFEADTIAAVLAKPTVDATNAVAAGGEQLVPHTGSVDLLQPGTDNDKNYTGTVFALSDAVQYYPGAYAAGILSESFSVTITTAGAAGVAKATVATQNGTYSRVNVPIIPINWDAANPTYKAMMYLGENLWAEFTGSETLEFVLGDIFEFSAAIDAPWAVVANRRILSGGTYTGVSDTTYKLEVTRGGVFNRAVNAIDGMQTPTKAIISYSDVLVVADTLDIGGLTFEVVSGGSPAAGNIAVDINGIAAKDDQFQELVDVINVQDVGLYASLDADADTVTIRGAYTLINGATENLTNATLAVQTALLVPSIDFTNDWTGGDVDDEYVLRCTQAGTIATARFSLESQNGDNVSLVQFGGSGVGYKINLGTVGMEGYFTVSGATFTLGDFWIITVKAARPQVTISDSVGTDQGGVVVVEQDTEFDVGLLGVTAVFHANPNNAGGFTTGGGLVTGDIFYIAATAAKEGPIKTLILADDLPVEATPGLTVDISGTVPVYNANYEPSAFAAWLYLVQNGASVTSKRLQSPPERNWLGTASDVTVYGGIQVQDPTWTENDGSMPWLDVYAGALYLEYRALLPDYSNGVYSLTDINDVVTELGVQSIDNPLAQGVHDALLNSGGKAVYFMAVPSDDLAGYQAVLDQAAKTDVLYGFAPLSRDPAIIEAVATHVVALSSATEKRWRRVFAGVELPVAKVAMDASTFTPPGTNWLATIKDNPSIVGTQNTLVEVTNGTPRLLRDVVAGDTVRCLFSTDAWGDSSYQDYVVAEVLTESKLLLESGPAIPVSVAAKIEIWHPLTTNEIAEEVAAQSLAYATKYTADHGNARICNVFPDVAYTDGVALTSEFMAAGIAGLESSVAPQQGLTNIELAGFDDLPAVYATFTRDQLNQMAGAGTMIVMQNMAGDTVYIRHQVTTATSEGNLHTQELSVGKNLDAISYYFANSLAPFIGRYNITKELLTVIETQIQDGLNYLGSNRTAVGLLGPMIILGDNTKINSVAQHPTLKDHVYASVDLELPLPVNVIQLHLVV